ncbi:BA75_00755T0 [Komagataella pastoris]|uniref:Cyclin-dependent kinase 8 n=1 Tax=Komagataella pastoris TaxID=4922 RepID=A0A1B2J578_PICPA|nr:BA75_00755T0 [Komagataella pastoris]
MNRLYNQTQQPMRMASNDFFSIGPYRKRKDQSRESVLDKYTILGYIASGTYGKVFKASGKSKDNQKQFYAIKKFKIDSKDSEITHYTGISQSAIREISLCKELKNENVINLTEIVLENKCIYMISEFAEYDLLQIIHHHSHPDLKPINEQMLKSILFQILQGLNYLHENWIIHRDLKPANIMVTSEGIVKIGDLGLARKFNNLLQTLYTGDKVVVTIWYRSPELLLGARHYTPAIDLWAVGCILAELLSLRPIFKGEEAKIDKKQLPFQENQLLKIIEILGTPNVHSWKSLKDYPEYHQLSKFNIFPPNLSAWFHSMGGQNKNCLGLLSNLLQYDPADRLSANNALSHEWFSESPAITKNVFKNTKVKYPIRKIQKDDVNLLNQSQQYSNIGQKRAIQDDGSRKRRA